MTSNSLTQIYGAREGTWREKKIISCARDSISCARDAVSCARDNFFLSPCPFAGSVQITMKFRLDMVGGSLVNCITGSAVALHCCKAHAKINGKIENSTPCKIVTREDFNLKLGIRDYVAEPTHHAILGSNRPSGGFPPNRGNITPV